MLVMRVQPDEGISLRFNVKTPGAENELTPELEISPVDMDFSYDEAFGGETPPAYQTLLLDIMIGDADAVHAERRSRSCVEHHRSIVEAARAAARQSACTLRRRHVGAE